MPIRRISDRAMIKVANCGLLVRVGLMRAVFALSTLFLLFSIGGPAHGLEAERTVFQYKHSHWSVADGAPPGIYALTQGRDGFLWIGSFNGLYRFDGLTFEQIPSTENAGSRVSALLTSSGGTIWVGYSSGEIATYERGALRAVRSAPRTATYVMNLVETQDGAIWVALGRPDHALLRHVGGRWQAIGTDWGLPQEWLIDTFVARDGSLWVTTVRSILILRKDARHFERVGTPSGHATVSEDPAGRIWLSDDAGTRVLFGERPGGVSKIVFSTPRAKRSFRARFDSKGNLWGANGDGLFRLRSPAAGRGASSSDTISRVEHFTENDGLTSDQTVTVLEDREGNIWIGTSLGLDQFRRTNVVAEPALRRPAVWGIILYGASDGTVYVGTIDAVYRVAPGKAPQPVIKGVSSPQAMCEGPRGNVWVILQGEILRMHKRTVARLRSPRTSEEGVENCALDRQNVLWANGGRYGLLSYESGKWQRHLPASGQRWASLLVGGRDGRLLALLRSGELVRLSSRGTTEEVLLRHDADGINMIQDGPHGVFVGGPFGLGLVHQGQLQLASARQFPWLARPTGLVETESGQTWLITAQGVVSLSSPHLDRAFRDRSASLKPLLFGFEDGLPNVQNEGGPNAVLGGDGRIWFSTLGGAVWVDPARLERNAVPPPVVIRAVIAAGTRYRDPTNLALSKGTSSLTIQYAGLSLAIPSRVRFRYRLEGVDSGWVDAGTRREAGYSNLGPGNYRFRVLAANNDGVWNRDGAMLEFGIPPTFLQSYWFKAIGIVLFIFLAWSAYTLRLRQVTARLQSRFDIRVAERERIARELHDTLLQGVQGLLLRFQAVANRIPAEDSLRGAVDEALDRADAVLIEGRSRVRDLRSETAECDLPESLLNAAADVVDSDTPRVQLTVEGIPRPLHPIVREEAQRIGEEAIRNAVHHAQAEEIELLVTYGGRELRMAVRDDGIGIPETVARSGRRAGHFGLIGMRERAERIGGRLAVTSREHRGTEVALTLSAYAAYADGGTRLLDRLRSAAWRKGDR